MSDAQMKCPKCKAVAFDITPLKVKDARIAVFGCSGCGFAFKADGGAFIEDADKLKEHFRGAALAQGTLQDLIKGEVLNPATQALFQAKLLEYGLQMWFDGCKQGLLLGVIRETKAQVPPGV